VSQGCLACTLEARSYVRHPYRATAGAIVLRRSSKSPRGPLKAGRLQHYRFRLRHGAARIARNDGAARTSLTGVGDCSRVPGQSGWPVGRRSIWPCPGLTNLQFDLGPTSGSPACKPTSAWRSDFELPSVSAIILRMRIMLSRPGECRLFGQAVASFIITNISNL
jgi:hypothetical protein